MILRNPEGGEGGNAPPPAIPPVVPTVVSITPEQHRVLLEAAAERDRFKAEAEQREADRRQAEEEQLRKKGEYEKLIANRDEELARERKEKADIAERSRKSEITRSLAVALSRHTLREGWAPQLMQLWQGQLKAEPEGDSWKTTTLDGKTVEQFVDAQLASPVYSPIVFVKAATGAANQGSTTARSDATSTPAVDPLGEQLKARMAGRNSPGLAGLGAN